MSFNIISYNILYNRAYDHVKKMFEEENADFLCLQEVDTDETNLKKLTSSFFSLADYSNSFVKFGKIFGQATFYNPNKFKFLNSLPIELPQSFHEILLVIWRGINNPRMALKTDFIYKPSNKKVSIINLHLSALQASNNVRIKQLKEIFNSVENGNKQSIILAGDFNYPYGRKRFEALIKNYGLKEATNNLFYTVEYNFLNLFHYRAKLDYILYKNIKLLETRRIAVRNSDHFPILSSFGLK